MKNLSRIASVDPGEHKSGVVFIEDGRITRAGSWDNDLLVSNITNFAHDGPYNLFIEDLRATRSRQMKNLIATAEFIGQLKWRLKELQITFMLVPRMEVKKWIFEHFFEDLDEKIQHRMALHDQQRAKDGRKRLRNKDGVLYKSNFIWIEDRMIARVMRKMWKIEQPKPGKSYELGFTLDSFQALAIASYMLVRHGH